MKVLVFGLGLNGGGVGSAKFFAQKGDKVKVTDLKSAEVLKSSLERLKDFPITYTLGEHKRQDLDWADLIIKNPAVKPGNPYMEYARSKGKRVEQDMGIFLDNVLPSQIIGITGTKGKSTTASLIYDVLKGIGEKVILAGNIGNSVLDATEKIGKKTLVVLELSSFQLESFDAHQVSSKYAVITNIYEDHLNYYSSMAEYTNAKRVIGKYQSKDDYLFINKDDPTLNNDKFLEGLKGQIIFYSASDLHGFQFNLAGEHNKTNLAAALSVAKILGIDQQKALNIISSFKGIPFRQELVKEWHRVKIINDTTATNPEAGIQAIKTFPNCILICGGMNKGMNYEKFAIQVAKNTKKVFFLEGDATNEIKKNLSLIDIHLSFKTHHTPNTQKSASQIGGTYNHLEKLLSDIKAIVKPGDIILFSPAATSFNLFQNEFDRGRKFNEAVQRVFSDV